MTLVGRNSDFDSPGYFAELVATEAHQWQTFPDIRRLRHLTAECQVARDGAPACPGCLTSDLEAIGLPDEDRLR